MTSQNKDYKFVLNQFFLGENGASMNVAEIKKSRDEANAKILEILVGLERRTGMVVSSIDVDYDFDDDGKNTGVTKASVRLDLE